uniref:BHLH domain-containing protein n=1 Tax=Anopheles atroparvus TaxID=41427 RepID=A0AAG5CUH7_ANOAO
MRHNNIESISAITYNQRPSTEASMADANNNHGIAGSPYGALGALAADGAGTLPSEIKKDEKYSLRQRQSRRTTQDALVASGGGRGGATVKATAAAAAIAKEKATPKEKPKPKAAPLSKYRRKTANARERSRMREINSAFENLRRAVPVAVAGPSGASSPVSSPQCASSAASSEKLTKITTLRLAMKYIRILSDMLHGDGGGGGENNNDRDTVNHNEIEREVMQKGLLLMEGGYLSSPAVSPVRAPAEPVKPASTKSSSSSGNTTSSSSPRKRTQTKRTSSSRAKKSTSSSSSTSSSTRSTARTRALASSLAAEKIPESQLQLQTPAPSLLADPTRPDPLGMDVDLGSVLESDNDSLILSEPCLSPLTAGSVTGGLKSHGFGCPGSQSVVPNDSLEFGLFLESDADSLQLSEPCLSPLGHLDSLNPFNELLHTGFNEQTALELYL